MATVASQAPIRTPSGGTTDQPWQPLADCGNGNPLFYHMFSDDFDQSIGVTGMYTSTGSTGSAALTAGDGGLVTFTTGAVAGNYNYIQLPIASYTVNTPPKKLFYLTRIQLAAVTTSTFVLGLVQSTTTPLTVVNGVYFAKAAGSTQITLNVTVASSTTSVNIPTSAYTLANNTNIDLAFYIDRFGNVLAYVDTQLVGFVPQSNIGTTNGPQNAGAVARLTTPTMPTANLALTACVGNGATAAATTMTMDFHCMQKER